MADIPLDLAQALRRAVAAYEAGQFAEAERHARPVVAARPDVFEAVHLLAAILSRQGKMDEALAAYDRAVALRPGSADALNDRGSALHALRRHHEALATFNRALAARPDHAAALGNRGNTLHALGRHREAIDSYDAALALEPNSAGTLNNRGNALKELKRFEEALASYDRALALRPDHAEAINNRGTIFTQLNRFDEAAASYDRALAIQPNYALAHYNRGNALQELKRFDEALASYDLAIGLQPDYDDAKTNWALCQLLTGDFEHGWHSYESARRFDHIWKGQRKSADRLWHGDQDIAGKTLLLHYDQGFGDTIQFCRYGTLVAERGARVILEVQEPLQSLVATLPGVSQVVAQGGALPDFDFRSPLLTLPLAFRTRLSSIPSAVPYLRATPEASTAWAARLGPKRRPRIGLAWSGSPRHRYDYKRSSSLRAFLPLTETDASFVSVKKEVSADDLAVLKERSDILHFGDELTDFSDTAALISNLDLVIAVDTSVAHLAGALGKPVWVLLNHIPEWRWLLERDDSPWYPTARLFRQDQSRFWDNVIVRVRDALCDFVQARRAGD